LTLRKDNPSAPPLRLPTRAELRARADSARDAMADGARQARDAVTRGAQHPVTRGTRDAMTRGARQAVSQGARIVHDPSRRWKAAVATAAIGAIAGVCASTPWASAASGQMQTIYDSVNPTAIPAGQQVATYSDGTYQASSASVAGRGNVLWIDTNGSDTHADALDVEPGDETPAQAAQWVSAKLSASPHSDAIVYTLKNDWPSVRASIDTLPSWMQSQVKYWIADPTGTPHILPGASATQWYWGSEYDISLAQPGFFN
jgi:hypothetical protein